MPQTNILGRFRNIWNTFRERDPSQNGAEISYQDIGPGSTRREDRSRLSITTERSIAAPLYNRIGVDVSSIDIRHVRLDENDKYLETINSGLNNCLSLEANIDQSGRNFIQDVVMSLCDEGAIAIVPIDLTANPMLSESYDVLSMRTGKILEWYPYHVRVNVYNEQKGIRQDITLSKKMVSIIENPLYSVMNEPNGALKRLIAKLNLLDAIDLQSGSGKLDLIIQLPYVIKTQARKEQAELRRQDIESQLKDSKYGIAYTDGTERITQLNRPAENNLMGQIEFLTSMLYGQLGLTESIFDGTADEKTMINYYKRTVEPMLMAISDGLKRRFLSKTARSQKQSIKYFRDPFGLVPTSEICSLADSLIRNEVISPNEFRSVLNYRPNSDEKSDQLRNPNLNPQKESEDI